MKKTKIAMLTLLAIPFLAGCELPRGNEGGKLPVDSEKSLALQAASSFALLSKGSAARALRMKSQAVTDIEIKEIQTILPTLDLFLENGLGVNSEAKKENVTVLGVTYDTKETLSFLDPTGKSASITLLYNENEQKSKEEIEKEEGETETTLVSWVQGLAFLEEGSYLPFLSFVKSEEETEIEEGKTEIEKEEERTFILQTGEKSHIKVKQEIETEGNETEESFSYGVKENGKVTLEYEISLESNFKGKEVSYELGEKEYELRLIEENGETIYLVEYENEEGKNETEATLRFKKEVDGSGNVSYTLIQ